MELPAILYFESRRSAYHNEKLAGFTAETETLNTFVSFLCGTLKNKSQLPVENS